MYSNLLLSAAKLLRGRHVSTNFVVKNRFFKNFDIPTPLALDPLL